MRGPIVLGNLENVRIGGRPSIVAFHCEEQIISISDDFQRVMLQVVIPLMIMALVM